MLTVIALAIMAGDDISQLGPLAVLQIVLGVAFGCSRVLAVEFVM